IFNLPSMFAYLIKVTICWVGFYLIYSVFLKKETFFHVNRWYLLSTLFLGVLIPLVEFLPIFQEDNTAMVYLLPLNESVFYVESAVNEAVVESTFDWMQLFWGVYFSGVIFFGLRFLVGLGKILKLYLDAEKVKKANHTLVLTNHLHLPFSFFKMMFWSKNLTITTADEQKILTHEAAHVEGWHSVDVMLCEIMSIIFWCSPPVYFYKKSLKTVHEYLADAVVLQTTSTKKYGRLLLQQSQSGLQVALANHFIHSQLKQRIIMMTGNKSRKEAAIKYLFALPVILLLFIAFSKKEAFANTDTPTTEITDNTTPTNTEMLTSVATVVGNDVDEMPLFPGCEDEENKAAMRKCSDENLLKHIYMNIKYPKEARKAGTEGRVIVKFTVGADGTITKAHVAQDIGNGCGDAALSVINTLPKMIPATKDGKAVAVEMVIPVNFKLQGDNREVKDSEEKAAPSSPNEIHVVGMGVPQKKKGFHKMTIDEIDEYARGVDVNFILDGNQSTLEQIKSLDEKDIKEIIYFDATKNTGNGGREVRVINVITKDYKPSPSKASDDESSPVFKVVEDMPRFAGCEDISDDKTERKKCAEANMLKYIYNNIKYPKAAREAGVQGRVIIQFVVKKDGSIANSKVLRDPGSGLGAEAQRVIDSMPTWIPGKQKGEAVDVQYVMPVSFKMTDGKTKDETDKSFGKEGNPLIVIDGKITKANRKNKLSELDVDNISAINILKGEAAIKKYGDAGKDGVVEITLLEKSEDDTVSDQAELPVVQGTQVRAHPKAKQSKMEKVGLKSVTISPNPTSDVINIDYEAAVQNMEVIGYDMYGKELFRYNEKGGKRTIPNISVKDVPKGMLLVVFKKDGEVYTETVVVQ
ncbi:MAG: TonB family protein, partial [Bacteroidota bacterium]